MVASTDPEHLPRHSTWYLLTNLPRPATRRAQQANLVEVVGLYGLRNWVEQGYKQVKGELGWADFQVRSDRAIRRHWALVCCAFSFCWQAFLAEHPAQPTAPGSRAAAPAAARGAQPGGHRRRTSRQQLLAGGGAGGAAWGARSRASCCVLVLVDQSTEGVAAAQLANSDCTHRISNHRRHRRRVGQAAVRPSLVVMLDVASQDANKLRAADDQQMVRHSRRTVPSHRSATAFALGACTGVRITSAPVERHTSSNAL